MRRTAWHTHAGDAPGIRTWYGSLVEGMRDGSGKMYMRNHYYDPGTGQFTQPVTREARVNERIGHTRELEAREQRQGSPVRHRKRQ